MKRIFRAGIVLGITLATIQSANCATRYYTVTTPAHYYSAQSYNMMPRHYHLNPNVKNFRAIAQPKIKKFDHTKRYNKHTGNYNSVPHKNYRLFYR